MDKYSRKTKKIRYWIPVAAATLAAALGAAHAAAYYAAEIDTVHEVKTAEITFGGEEDAVEEDYSEMDSRILPYQDGDSFEVGFRTVYTGNVPCIAVPRLNVKAGNFSPGDRITVSDGKNVGILKDGEADLYSDPRPVQPGEMIECVYRITIAGHTGEDPLLFDYDFGIAAVQEANNEEFLDGNAGGEEVFDEIRDKLDGKESEAAGFTDYIGTGEEEGADEERRSYAVELIPSVTAGFTENYLFRWYAAFPGEEEQLLSEGPQPSRMLVLSNAHDGLKLRYEISNEAGIAASAILTVRTAGEKLEFEESVYEGDFSERKGWT